MRRRRPTRSGSAPVTGLVLAAVASASMAVPASASGGQVHEIQQEGLTFVPKTKTVQPGDVVRWTWNDGFHTVTSGTDCLPDGAFFNEGLFSGNPIFEWQVPDDLDRDVPYYCAPHCGLDMIGVLVLASDRCTADLDGSGEVDFEDLLILLTAWGPCDECPEDLDGNGAVEFNDILLLLATWGPCG